MKRKRVGGDEQEAFSRVCRHWVRWRSGERSRLKTRANRRECRQARESLRREGE